jgi:hypothetical protein
MAMDTDFSFDRRTGLLRLTIRGEVQGPALARLVGVAREVNERLHPSRVIYDCSGVTVIDLPTPQVDSLAHVRPVFAPEATEVILAPQDYLYGIARMFQAMVAEARPNVRVVRSWPEAHQALGVSDPPQYERLEA